MRVEREQRPRDVALCSLTSCKNTGGDWCEHDHSFDVFFRVAPPAPSPALPEAMAGATGMGGYLATARATQLVDIVR